MKRSRSSRNIGVFTPESDIKTVLEDQAGLGVVLLGPMSSRVFMPFRRVLGLPKNEPGELGDDAQSLADSLGMPVIAANRPHAHGLLGWRLRASLSGESVIDTYTERMRKIGMAINTIAQENGVDRLVAVGRSAGALGALALTASNGAENIEAVIGAEPAGFEYTTFPKGLSRYKRYLDQQTELLNRKDIDLIRPEPTAVTGRRRAIARGIGIVTGTIADMLRNRRVFMTTSAKTYLRLIKQNTDCKVFLEFAEHSMIVDGSAPAYTDVYSEFNGSTISIDRSEHTSHASYDKRSYFNQLVRDILRRNYLDSPEANTIH